MLKPIAWLAVLALCLPLAAQTFPVPAEAGLGAVVAGPVELDSVTTNNGQLGVTYVPFTGTVVVSSRATPITAGVPHVFYEFSLPTPGSPATLLNTYNQSGTYQAAVTLPSSGAWGNRDLTTDDGFLMFGGDETGVYAYDTSAGFTQVTGQITWIAALGAVASTATWPLPLPTGVANARGLAFDPNGNGGQGSLLTANFGTAITEFDINGVVINTIPWDLSWSVYGLTIDPRTGNIWAASGSINGDIVEIDRTSGLPTGARIVRSFPGTAQGGLSTISGPAAQAAYGVDVALLCLDQGGAGAAGTADSFSVYRLHRYALLNGQDEARLEAEFSGQGVPLTGIRSSLDGNYTSPSTFQLEVADPTGAAAIQPMTLLASLLADATVGAVTPGVPELVTPGFFSLPATTGATFVVADGLGIAPFLGINLPVFTPLTQTPTFPFPSPILPVGTSVRFQAIVLEPALGAIPLLPTNTVTYTYQSPITQFGGRVEAEGANPFNAVTTGGFFKIINTNPTGTGPSIVEVEFDNAPSTNPLIQAMVYNYNQTGMLDQFVFGNSAIAGCSGTYRNGSAAATGLIFDNMNTFGGTASGAALNNAIACDTTALCGFSTRTNNGGQATANGGTMTDFRFRFAPGTFVGGLQLEFDVDTDGGPGLTGDVHAGIVIRITYDNGITNVGELVVDPARPQLSAVNL